VLKDFYQRRFFRLFPVLLANALVGSLVLFFADNRIYPQYILRALLYVRNIFGSSSQGHDLWMHTWSLAAEEQFYLLYPVILFLLLKKIGNKVALVIILTAYFLFCQGINQTHFHFSSLAILNWNLMTRPSGLALGCALGLISHFFKLSLTNSQVVFLQLFSLTTGIVAARMQSSFWIDVMTACLLLSCETDKTSSDLNLVKRALSYRPLPYLGRLSYSIYMWHPLVIFSVFHFLPHPSIARGTFALIAVGLISMASFHFVEIPLNDYLKRRYIYA
jgi:peptidoglycan/LPS O-acetylase OafA/YrhL